MIRELTENDAYDLAFADTTLSEEQYWEMLTRPGMYGVIEEYDFIIGMVIEGELWIEFTSAEALLMPDLWTKIRLKFNAIKVEFSLDKQDHKRAIAFLDAGFTDPAISGPMRFQLSR